LAAIARRRVHLHIARFAGNLPIVIPARAGIQALLYNRAAMPPDILLISAARALIEVAGLMLIARGVMWLFGPRAREHNFFYWVLTTGTLPFIRLARAVSPRAVSDTYTPVVAFVLLFVLWIAAGVGKEWLCSARSVVCV
jgi:hypothetical protein